MAEIKIDPRFIIPDVQGVEYDGGTSGVSDPFLGGIFTHEVTPGTGWDGQDSPALPTGTLEPPSSISIISQTSRMTETGQTVVDVLIEVADVPGAAEYEVRMAVG